MADKKKWTWAIAIGSVVVVASMFVFLLKTNGENKELKRDLAKIEQVQEENYADPLFPEEVAIYRNFFDDEAERFLSGKHEEMDEIGRESLKNIFAIVGSFHLSDEPTEKELADFYEPFDYEYTNVSGYQTVTTNGKIISLVGNIDITYNGEQEHGGYHVMRTDFNEEGQLIGGGFYGKQ